MERFNVVNNSCDGFLDTLESWLQLVQPGTGMM